MKRPIFVVAKLGSGRKINSEADLRASLAADYRALLAEFPMRDKAWQIHVQSGNKTAREEIAWGLLHRNLELVAALRDGLPAWEVAALGMSYQDLLMIYRGPSDERFRGRQYSKDKQPRRADDELTMRVLVYLRRRLGTTWKESLRALQDAADNMTRVARVDIEYDEGSDRWTFRQGDTVEAFQTSTLERRKFPKA